jgi:hypothetical protein
MATNKRPECYNGQQNLKASGVQISFTAEQVDEWIKCSKDPIYFIKKYVKVIHVDRGTVPFALHPYQERLILAYHENRKVIALAPRQYGKTICTAAYFLWVVLFNTDKNIAILANKAAMAREILSRIQFSYENLPFWIQQGVVEWNKGSIKLDNNSKIFTAATSPNAIRGSSCVVGETKICILEDNGDIFYKRIDSNMNKSDQLLYTVYQIKNKLNSKIYVGYHQTYDLEDGYMGSGKLIKRAIEKYGIHNFEKSILGIFSSKEEAEAYEAKIVDKEFTLREDTYNLQIGGNVRITYGENNPFFGKTHSDETRKKLSEMNLGSSKPRKWIVDGDQSFGTLEEAGIYLDIKENPRLHVLIACGNPELSIRYKDAEDQKIAEKYFIQREIDLKLSNEKNSKLCSERFLGVAKSEEHKAKIGLAHTGTTKEYVGLITNKNPEKIRKTAEKHRGMKRSEETKKNIAASRNIFFSNGGINPIKGKFKLFNKETGKISYVTKEEKELILSQNTEFTDEKICKIINETGSTKWHIKNDPLPVGWVYNVRKSPKKEKK